LGVTWKPIVIGLLAVGCAAKVGDGDPNATPDSGATVKLDGGNGGGDSNVNPMDAPSACPNSRKVYLHFDGGITLQQAATSNSATNQASWLNNGSANIPPWRNGAGDRQTQITTVVNGVKARLATTPLEVVTTRPASGLYVMIVFGGNSTGNGGTVGTPYGGSTNEHDCGDTVKPDVGWVSEQINTSYAQDIAVGAIGWGLGLNGTTDPNDCMCAWANNCQSASGACTLATQINTVTSAAPATTCPNQNPQNEVEAFTTKFCAL
jgi:hypothetical protein